MTEAIFTEEEEGPQRALREDMGGTRADYFYFVEKAVEVWRG